MKKMAIVALVILTSFHLTLHAEETLNGAGATFPAPLYSSWAYEYNKVTGTKINYQSIGSGGGQRQIVERTVDFGASDDALASNQLVKNDLLQFPTVIGGIAPVVNIPGIKSNELQLDATVHCKIFMGEIKFWDDASIKGLNPNAKLTHQAITVVHRSDGSGTTAIFTHYLAETCPAWKEKVGEGKAVSWPTGIGGKGNEGVANYVKHTPHSIGYVEFAYAQQNKMTSVKMKNAAGNFVAASFENLSDAAGTAVLDPKKDFQAWITNAPGKTSWPIAGATFILLAKNKKESNIRIVKFFDWAFKNGDSTAKRLTYIPLPNTLKDKIRAYWKANGLY